MSVNLSESPLANELRIVADNNSSNAYPSDASLRSLRRLGMVDGTWDLTDTGRATLAALSLPDPGEPELWQGSEDGPREAVFGAAIVRRGEGNTWRVKLWEDATTCPGSSVEAELWGEQPLSKALELAAALIAAHALAEQWRAEVGG